MSHSGEFRQCVDADIHSVTVDGGYAEATPVNAEVLAAVPGVRRCAVRARQSPGLSGVDESRTTNH